MQRSDAGRAKWVGALAILLTLIACGRDLPPAPPVLGKLSRGVTPAESLAIRALGDSALASRTAPSKAITPAGTCTITWSAPNAVIGCSAPAPTIVPAVPWLEHSGHALDPGEIEQRAPISIRFGGPASGVTLTSIGALKCSGSLGTLVGYRNGVQVAAAANALTDPSDCAEDDVTFGVTGQFPADAAIDSLVIVGVDPWTFSVLGTPGGRALLRYTLTYQPQPESLSVVITAVQTAHSGSFTTLPDERTVAMTAVTVPASLTNSVQWTVTGFAGDAVPSIPPDAASLGQGATVSWQVPAQDSVRWHAFTHPGTLPQKSLAYVIVASVTDASGTTAQSTPDTLRQDEIDTMLEEYIELARDTVPVRARFGTNTSAHFGAGELNRTGDYTLYIAEPVLLTGLEALRTVMGTALGQETPLHVTSAYRNPVHQTIYLHSTHRESRHQYGTAADLRIIDQAVPPDEFFRFLYDATNDPGVDACSEPATTIRKESGNNTLSHAHVDWRVKCPTAWEKQ